MLSARSRVAVEVNAWSALVARRRASGRPFVDLTASNPTLLGLSPPDALVREALSRPEVTAYDPSPLGARAAREAVARYYRDAGADVSPDHVVLSASTSEAYGWLFGLLCDAGDEVLVAHPSYPLFDELARLAGVALAPFPLAYEGRWLVEPEAVARALTPRTRAVALVHPNNPTGSYVPRDAARALSTLCAERGVALVVDEVFRDWAWGDDARRAGTFAGVDDALTFTLSGLSKVCCLPQVKLGWTVVSGPAPLRDEALRRLEHVADAYLSVSASAQHACAPLLAARGAVLDAGLARVRRNLAALRACVGDASAATVLGAEGGWYAVLRVPRTRSEDAWVEHLLDAADALVQPGWLYDFPREAMLVLSLLPREDEFASAAARVVAAIDEG